MVIINLGFFFNYNVNVLINSVKYLDGLALATWLWAQNQLYIVAAVVCSSVLIILYSIRHFILFTMYSHANGRLSLYCSSVSAINVVIRS